MLTLRSVFRNANSGLEGNRAKRRHNPNIRRLWVLQGAWGHHSCVLIPLPLGFADPDVGRGIKTAVVDLKLTLLRQGGASAASTMANYCMSVTCIPRLTADAGPFRRGAGRSTMLRFAHDLFPGSSLGKADIRAVLDFQTNRAS